MNCGNLFGIRFLGSQEDRVPEVRGFRDLKVFRFGIVLGDLGYLWVVRYNKVPEI